MKLNKHIKNKTFVKIIFSLLSIFILFHFTIWNIYTKSIFDISQNNMVGDLSRLSYSTKSIVLREIQKPLFFNLSNWDGKAVDLLTIGDSFSNGGGGLYYQNFIIQTQKLRILNIEKIDNSSSYIETISILNNNGELAKINPKSILIESIERKCIDRLTKDVDFNKTNSTIFTNIKTKKYNHTNKKIKKISFINNSNYNAFLYNLLYPLNEHAYFSKIYKASLDKKLFTNATPYTLLYYDNDLKSIDNSTYENIKILNENLNKLTKILNKKNIKLYFMPTVDKYNLYSKHIVDNKHKNSTFFEFLRKENKLYFFIDTKKILTQKLLKKDLYWADDTHWNKKAIEETFKNILFQKY